MSEIVDQTRGSLEAALIYATSIQDDSLKECLKRLGKYNESIEVLIYSDPAPYSFYFVKEDKYKGYLGDAGIHYFRKKQVLMDEANKKVITFVKSLIR